MCRFIYTGEVFVPQTELQDFLKTAELLEIKGLLRDADDPSWSNLSSLFPATAAPPPPTATNQIIAPSSSVGLLQHINQQQPQQQQQQKILSIINGNAAAAAAATATTAAGQAVIAAGNGGPTAILPSLPTVPVSSVFLPSPAPPSEGKHVGWG